MATLPKVLISRADYQIGGGVALRLRTQGGPFWTPIRGPVPMPIDNRSDEASAIWSRSGEKRTQRGRRRSEAFDPSQPFGDQFCCAGQQAIPMSRRLQRAKCGSASASWPSCARPASLCQRESMLPSRCSTRRPMRPQTTPNYSGTHCLHSDSEQSFDWPMGLLIQSSKLSKF
jgi:hypothetical protein